tara:strand:- start:10217 stop:11335 length:1119 start_codon:yes stop_codon:yes gene_type:complete
MGIGSSKDMEMDDYQRKFINIKADFDNYKLKTSNVININKTLENRISDLEFSKTNLETLNNDLKKNCGIMKQQLEVLEDYKLTTNDKVNKLETLNNLLVEENNKLNCDNCTFKELHLNLKEDNNELLEFNKDLNKKHRILESELSAYESTNNILEERNNDLKIELLQLKETNNSLEKTNSELILRTDSLDTIIRELNDKKDNLEDIINKYTLDNETLEQTNMYMKQENSDLHKKNEELNSENNNYIDLINIEKDKLQNTCDELDSMTNNCNILEENNAKLLQVNNDLINNVDTYNGKYLEIKLDYDDYKTLIKDKLNEIFEDYKSNDDLIEKILKENDTMLPNIFEKNIIKYTYSSLLNEIEKKMKCTILKN